jgi:hypothetical protein
MVPVGWHALSTGVDLRRVDGQVAGLGALATLSSAV